MSTTILEALDFSWNHADDRMYQVEYQNLPILAKISKIISDWIVYVFASILRIDTLEKIANRRISISAAEEYKAYIYNNSYTSLHNQSVILVLYGELAIPVSPESYRQLEEQSNCKIKFKEIERLEDIELELESLKRCNNKVKALWIRAHGTPFSITFNQDTRISIGPTGLEKLDSSNRMETRTFLQKQLRQLEPDAPIILESCYTGQEMEVGKENVAQFIASVAGGRKVYAPSREALPIDKSIEYVPGQGFRVMIKSLQSSACFAQGSIFARMCAVWHAFCMNEEDITGEFTAENLVH